MPYYKKKYLSEPDSYYESICKMTPEWPKTMDSFLAFMTSNVKTEEAIERQKIIKKVQNDPKLLEEILKGIKK